MELKLFTTFIVVAAILASPKHKAFTWSYRSSIYRVHWEKYEEYNKNTTLLLVIKLVLRSKNSQLYYFLVSQLHRRTLNFCLKVRFCSIYMQLRVTLYGCTIITTTIL